MKAIILAAGEKNEVSSITGDIPKTLIPIEDTTIIEIQLNVLHSIGIDDVTIIRGYKKEMINIPGVLYYDNDDYVNTNILYSLFCAEFELNEELLVVYGDVIFDRSCIERLLKSEGDISIGISVNLEKYKEDYIKELELVSFDSNNKAIHIGKYFKDTQCTYGQFTGLLKCSAKGTQIVKNNYEYFKLYNANYKSAYLSELLDNIIRLGIPISCVMIKKGWIKINSLLDYEYLKNQGEGCPNIFKMKTNWSLRSKTYDKIQWVNMDKPLDVMLEVCDFNRKNPVILDIGTGTGKVLKHFKQIYTDMEGHGIDISAEMMNFIDFGLGFHLQVCNVEDLSMYQDEMFDIIIARMSMHHVDNVEKALHQTKQKLKKNGNIIICEGNPPTKETLPFYKEVFSYKENRNVFLADDLINLLLDSGYHKVMTRTVILENMSLNNWISNAGIPQRNKDIITELHYNCEDFIKKAYNMKFIENDILMDWKFTIAKGIK